MLEQVRKKLRDLVQFIEKRSRNVLYTDFEDEMGEATSFDLLGITPPQDMESFKAKARAFLRDHQDHVAIHRLRMNKPLTASDLEALEGMLAEHGIGDAETITRAKEESQTTARLSLGCWFLANVALHVSPPEQRGQCEQRRDEGQQRKGEGGGYGEEESGHARPDRE